MDHRWERLFSKRLNGGGIGGGAQARIWKPSGMHAETDDSTRTDMPILVCLRMQMGGATQLLLVDILRQLYVKDGAYESELDCHP